MSTQETGRDEPDREVSWPARVSRESRREIGLMVGGESGETALHMMIICGSRLDVPPDGSRSSAPSVGAYVCTLPPHGDTGHACAVRNGAGQDEVADGAQGTYRTAVWDGPAGETTPLLGWSRTDPSSSHVKANLDVRTSRLFTAMRTMLASAAGLDTWEDMERVDMPLPDRLAEVINRLERTAHAADRVAVRDVRDMVASLETVARPDAPLPQRIQMVVNQTRQMLEDALVGREQARLAAVPSLPAADGERSAAGETGRTLIHPGDAVRYRSVDTAAWSSARFLAVSDGGTVVVDDETGQPCVLANRLAPPSGSVRRFALTNEARRGEVR